MDKGINKVIYHRCKACGMNSKMNMINVKHDLCEYPNTMLNYYILMNLKILSIDHDYGIGTVSLIINQT